MNSRYLQSIVRRIGAGLLMFFAIGHAGLATAEVRLPNGEYREQVEDLRVQILGGPLLVTRTWLALNINKGEYRWYLNPAWADLDFESDSLDGSIKSVSRAGSRFERSGNDIYVFENVYFIARQVDAAGTTTGWRWYDRLGNWIVYAADGKIQSYGDRNAVSVRFVRNGNGKISQVNDHHGAMALTIAYAPGGERVASVTDRSGRTVSYNYQGNGDLTEVIDVLGRHWTYGYSNGLLTSKSGPTCAPDPTCGDAEPVRTTTIRYSGNRVTGIVDPMTHETTWEYDFDRGKRQYTVVERSPEGRRTERRYDADGRLRIEMLGTRTLFALRRDGRNVDVVTNERGLTTRTEFDANRNIVKVTYPDGTTTSGVFHGRYNLPLEETNALGVRTKREYDAAGNLLVLTEALGTPDQRVTRYTYDEFGQVETKTIAGATPAGDIKTTYEYDGYGNVETITDAENRITRFSHHVTGQVQTRTDARNKTWTTTRDAAGRATALRDPLDHVESMLHGKFGNVVKLVDQLGKETVLTAWPSGRLKTSTNPNGATLTHTYNADGQLTKVRDPNGVETTFDYDTDGRLTTTTDAAGNATVETYGPAGAEAGLLTQRRYPTYCEEYKYDQVGRMTALTRVLPCDGQSPARETTTFGYDAKGRKISQTDASQRTTMFAYDALDRLTETTDALGGKTTYGYDLLNNRIRVKDPGGNTHRYVFDKVGQLVSETRPLGATISYAYDDAGNQTLRTNPDNTRRIRTFDDARRVTGEKLYATAQNTPSQTVTFGYDARNLLTSYTQVGDTNSSATYAYDDSRRRTAETVTYGFGSPSFTRTISHEYWPSGLKKRTTYPDQTAIDYTYDANNRLETAGLPGGGEIRWQEYEWQKATRVVMPGAVRTLQYDALQRPKQILSRAIGGGTAQAPAGATLLSLQYEYDAVGNIVERTADEGVYEYAYDALHRLTDATPPAAVQPPALANGLPAEHYGYDATNNRTSSTHQPGPWNYNADNQLLGYGAGTAQRRFEYNAGGQTTRVVEGEEPSTAQTRFVYDAAERLAEVSRNDVLLARYEYDPFGRRIRKQTQSGVVWFQYSDEGLAAEYSAAGTLVRAYGWMPLGTWGTAPLWLADKSGASWNVGFYHNDRGGTPLRVTAAGGDVVWSSLSEAFGRTVVAPASTVDNPLRLPGQYFDAETNLHYNYFRDYDPSVGRYVQGDPVGLAGGINLYAYASASPLVRFDPLGLQDEITTGEDACKALELGYDPPGDDCNCQKNVVIDLCNCYNEYNPYFQVAQHARCVIEARNKKGNCFKECKYLGCIYNPQNGTGVS